MLRERKWIFILLFLTVIQSMALFLCSEKRVSFYEDDLYSLQGAHFYLNEDMEFYERYFGSWKTFALDTWLDIGPMKDSFTVGKEESIFSVSVFSQVRRFFKGRNYFQILNALNVTFSEDTLDMKLPLKLNIFLHALTVLLLYAVLRKMDMSEPYALIGCAFYGLSVTAFNMALFIRFYTLTALYVLIAFYMNLIIRDTESIWKTLVFEILMLILFYLGMKNSELIFALAPIIIVCFSALFLLEKKYRKAGVHLGLSLVLGSVYLLGKDSVRQAIFHPGALRRSGSTSIDNFLLNILSGNLSLYFSHFKKALWMFVKGLFAGKIMFILAMAFLFSAAMVLLYRIIKKEVGFGEAALTLTVSLITLFYLLFTVISGLVEERYLSYIYPFAVISFVSVTSLAFTGVSWEKKGTCLTAVVIGLCSLMCVFYSISHAEVTMFTDFQNAVKPYSGLNVIELLPKDDNHWNSSLYECVYYMDSSSKVYYSKEGSETLKGAGDMKKALIWTVKDENEKKTGKRLERYMKKGYRLKRIGDTYNSVVYLLQK